MFTGLVEEVGKVKMVQRADQSMLLTISCTRVLAGVKIGDSMAVNGICLTLVEQGRDWFAAQVMPETFKKTGLGRLKIGDAVNLERPMLPGQRLDGHFVSGHIDGTGLIKSRQREGNALRLLVSASAGILKYIIAQGSVAIDGISLTVARVGSTDFEISLIPLTAKTTTLGSKQVGEEVNIEVDLIGKYVEKMLKQYLKTEERKGLSLEYLINQGFA